MQIIEVSPRRLTDRTERAQAKLARIARGDCWHGGARALVLAKRLDRLHCSFDPLAVVSDAYSSSTGTATNYLAYLCPECGTAHLGKEAASQCCGEIE